MRVRGDRERARNGGRRMSLTPRKVASLAGAAVLVIAVTGAGSAAGSAARASVATPSFSKLSASQVNARTSGGQERVVVVFKDQLANLPANRAHRQAPRGQPPPGAAPRLPPPHERT